VTVIKEEALRWSILVTAGLCWGISLTLSWLVIAQVISQVEHPGIGLIVFMAQGLAITLTIVWAQLRNRHTMIAVMHAGMAAARDDVREESTE
jgi:hypothetical protein